MRHGICRDLDPELFYPSERIGSVAKVKGICRGCPVRVDCLNYALARMTDLDVGSHGIWGGTTVNERWSILRRRVAA